MTCHALTYEIFQDVDTSVFQCVRYWSHMSANYKNFSQSVQTQRREGPGEEQKLEGQLQSFLRDTQTQ